jgi:hypothetical protein
LKALTPNTGCPQTGRNRRYRAIKPALPIAQACKMACSRTRGFPVEDRIEVERVELTARGKAALYLREKLDLGPIERCRIFRGVG